MNIEDAILTPQELRDRVNDANSSDVGSITDDVCNAELRRLAPLLADLWEAASHTMQQHLDDYGHGQVADWGPAMEEALGWGDCGLLQLGRALAKLHKRVQNSDSE